MMTNFKKQIVFFILAALFFSCNKYLDVTPDSSFDITIDSEEKISELLTGAYPDASYFPFLETRTDNVGQRTYGEHYQLNEAMYFWEDYDQEDLDTPLAYWNACYRGIAQANKALELLKAYPKTDRVKALYGEAFLLRAYLHFMLVNIWAEPYRGEESKQAMGIPYLRRPEKNALVDYSRGTVAEVYDRIEEDLKLGITLVNDAYYRKPKYHFNKKAAYAFASRFYLMKGQWHEVVQYANYVLGATPKLLIRDWASYEKEYRFNRLNLHQRYNATTEPSNLLLATTESRWARDLPVQTYGTTQIEMKEIYNGRGFTGCTDYEKLNLALAYVFNSSPSPIKEGAYTAKFGELSLFGSTGTRPRDLYVTNVLLSVDEVLLNRMEAYTMLSQYDAAIDDLLTFLQTKYHMVPPCSRNVYTNSSSDFYNSISPFYGVSRKQLGLLKIVLDFRQKEFLHEGLRWFDIRRFYIAVQRSSRHSLYRPLEKDDYRKVLQIPAEAIRRGLKPNPRNEIHTNN
uniref:RagB/SusD family nutrient uptake outer membrane protein n=2 Tax=Porphyromonas macacae TaxID=28115 RepID=UPI001269BDD4|nr:RagB/SusD family nutrient uptake outer membrane protein [Porphyromonas macacae]